ncbi:uncharacterized protein LOC141903611 [Tubulanus polymorphus]|uniref:uncharacterized protein LOC141903611 n=1 Tax=Tubulanus polymorphus TaxID=672921 RepID=UPI003DA2281F
MNMSKRHRDLSYRLKLSNKRQQTSTTSISQQTPVSVTSPSPTTTTAAPSSTGAYDGTMKKAEHHRRDIRMSGLGKKDSDKSEFEKLSGFDMMSPIGRRKMCIQRTPVQAVMLDDFNFQGSQISDSQADVKWDCTSPEAIKNVQLVNGESKSLNDMLKIVSSQQAPVPSSTPPLLGIWMQKNDHESSSPKRAIQKTRMGIRKAGVERRRKDILSTSSLELLQRLAAVVEKQKEPKRVDYQLRTDQDMTSTDLFDSDDVPGFPTRSQFEPSPILHPTVRIQSQNSAEITHRSSNSPAAAGNNSSKDMFTDESWENIPLDVAIVENKAVADRSKANPDVGNKSWDDDDLFNSSFLMKATQTMTDELYDANTQRFRTPQPKSTDATDVSRLPGNSRFPQNVSNQRRRSPSETTTPVIRQKLFGPARNSSKNPANFKAKSNVYRNSSKNSDSKTSNTTCVKKAVGDTNVSKMKNAFANKKSPPLKFSSPKVNAHSTVPSWKDTSITDDLLMELAEPDEILDSQVSQLKARTYQNHDGIIAPTPVNNLNKTACSRGNSKVNDTPSIAGSSSSSIAKSNCVSSSQASTVILAVSDCQDIAPRSQTKGESLGFDFCDDEMLSEPAILAMLDEVESQATQSSQRSTGSSSLSSSQPKYSADDIEKKKLAAIKRRQEKITSSQIRYA